jgi:NAD(P)-dependent dehydrogenase (short-subunit alcohol dehydrogenase family)
LIVRGTASFLVGATLGVTVAAGNALLLYTGQGFLRAAGLLVSSAMMAVAAGVWAGTPEVPEDVPASSRARWIALVLALLAGGAFTALWGSRPALRELPVGGAFAVLLVLAVPAYAAGTLLVGLYVRDGGGAAGSRNPAGLDGSSSVAAAALAGAAIGVLLATTVLIQRIEPWGIYYGGAALLTAAALMEWRTSAHGHRKAEMDMRDYVVIITGAGDRGQLGFAIARLFAGAGARLALTGRSPDVEELADELGGDGGMAFGIAADLTDARAIERLMHAVRERYGRVDVLVNTAGGLSVTGPVAETSPEAWLGEVERNAGTALRMSRAALPLLRESGGSIINFAAPGGLRAVAGLGAYSAAKAGVIALTRALALEEKANGVRVNAIAPGIMDTEQNRSSAGEHAVFVPRDDVASAVLFLASPAARGITGETIHVLGPTLE